MRRAVLDRLQQLGDAIVPALVAALPDAHWHLQRNIVALLRDAGRDAIARLADGGASLARLLESPELALRSAVVPLLVALDATRAEAVRRGVTDPE
nr:hypothetical protein [Gemmatimonadaceae bacterium]